MTPTEALANLDKIASVCKDPALTRADHVLLQQSVSVLRDYIAQNTCTGEACRRDDPEDKT